MKPILAVAVIVAVALALAAPFEGGRAHAQAGCVRTELAHGSVSGEWAGDCTSPNRPVSPNGPGDGSYYARYYDFYVFADSEVTITLESGDVDTYLYLLTGAGRNGTVIAQNDDIDTAGVNYNSRIVSTLQAGDYSIEATTYSPGVTGEFTLTLSGGGAATVTPTPPNPTPTQPPAVDECVEPIGADNTAIGAWTSDCLSTKRPLDADKPKTGDYYARYYTFSLSTPSDVTIDLNSSSDPYLYLLSGSGKNGVVLSGHDDIDPIAGNYNSRIEETLRAGDYTIEATTFAPAVTGSFTLALDVQDAAPPYPTDADRSVLIALYNATEGSSWENSANWLTAAPLGEWYGVTTNSDGRVTDLRLGWNNLSGGLPSELGDLSEMRVMRLNDNALSGAIPSELGNLTGLEEFDVGENKLTGAIPTELGSLVNLTWLSVGSNHLTGNIPSELGSLVNLDHLILHANNLTEELPQSLTFLNKLIELRFDSNDGLCAPNDADFQAWLQSITQVSGPKCADFDGWAHRPVFDGGIDLGVTYIERLPRYEKYKIAYLHSGECSYPYDEFKGAVLCPGQDGLKRWPDVGETVELRAHVWNFGDTASGSFAYRWLSDDIVISSGRHDGLGSGAHAAIPLSIQWPGSESNPTVTFEIDPGNEVAELLENNNTLVDWIKGHTIGFYFTPVAYQTLRLSNEPGQTIQSAEHWIHKNVSRLNELLIEAGVEDRVRSELFFISENKDLSRDSPLRYYMSWWPTIDNPDSFFTPDGYRDRPEIDWGLLHELLHQLGVIDLYQMRPGPDQVLLPDANRHGYKAGCGRDYWNHGWNCYEFPGGVNDIMSGSSARIVGKHTAGGLRSNAGHRRGFYGEYLYDTPQNTFVRVVDEGGNPLPSVSLRFYQYELQDAGHILDAIPEFTVTTDASGVAALPNRGITGIVTATGHQLKPNPFGHIDVVGTNGLFVIEMEGAACTNYEWLTVVDLNLAYWNGQTGSATFDRTLRCPPPSGSGAPAGIPADADAGDYLPPSYSPYSGFAAGSR